MSRLVCVGVNHKRAPVELREKVAFSAEKVTEALKILPTLEGVEEAVVLSTCNRVEVYVAGDPDVAPYQISNFLHDFHGLAPTVLDDHLFRLVGEDALSHLCRVASSLEAIVIGEPQILGQVKDAFSLASQEQCTGPVLNRSFQGAFVAAKRVRTETAIASSAVSVSYAGVELARKFFEVSGSEVLLIGAGEMGELAARHFVDKGARLIVCNRSIERAQRLADEVNGAAYTMESLERLLVNTDVVLASTSAPGFIITKEMMKRVVKKRRYRPIFLIDIAVPRDIDPDVSDLDLVYAYDVDDLHDVINENLDSRRDEADEAERIVSHEVLRMARRDRELRAVPTIKALREHFMTIAKEEAAKTLAVFGEGVNKKQSRSVEKMAEAIVNKILHEPITHLKEQSLKANQNEYDLFQAVKMLFELELKNKESSALQVLREAQEAEDALEPELREAAGLDRKVAQG